MDYVNKVGAGVWLMCLSNNLLAFAIVSVHFVNE